MKIQRAPDLGQVMAYPDQISQVLINLAANSRDTMSQGGHLSIEAFNKELDDSFHREHMEVNPGRCVQIAVSDDGVGMDQPTLDQVFEPFFTTKMLGKGPDSALWRRDVLIPLAP